MACFRKSHIYRSFIFCLSSLLLLVANHAAALSTEDVRFAGFASLVYGKTITDDKEEDTFVGLSNDGEYRDFNKLGLRMDADLKSDLRFTAQVIADGREDYDPTFDWIFVTVDLTSDLSLSIGKTRVPVFMYSDYLDTSYAYQWIQPPKTVYDLDQTPFKSIEGLKLRYLADLGGEWSSELLVWAGKTEDPFKTQGVDATLTIEDSYGLAWTVDRDWLSLRAFYYTGDASLDITTNPDLYGLLYGLELGDTVDVNNLVNLVATANDLEQQAIQLAQEAAISQDPGDAAAAAAAAAAAQSAFSDYQNAFLAEGAIEASEAIIQQLLDREADLADNILWDNDEGIFYGLGANLDFGDWFAVSEYTYIEVDTTIGAPELDSFYLMLGWRLPQNVTLSFTWGQDRNRANKKTWEEFDKYIPNNPTDPSETLVQGMLAGARDGIRAEVENFQIYDIDRYTLGVRWDFHRQAALKFETLTMDYEQNNSGNVLEPVGVRLGLDLIF